MTTNRTPTGRDRRRQITPDAVMAFALGDWAKLHHLLQLRPWEPSPLEADTDWPPVDAAQATRDGWAQSRQLRRQLEEAAAHADE